MTRSLVSQSVSRCLLVTAVATFASLAAVGCGLQEHKYGGLPGSGTGGATAGGTGGRGATSATGGATGTPGTGGSAGRTAATGGQTGTATGGQSGTATGGRVATGGQTGAATGGRAATGGQTGTATGGRGGTTGTPDASVPDASTPSGITVNINGTLVPKEKAIAFIHFGHSNMRGQASTPASLRPFFYDTQPGLWTYQGAGRFVLAKEPTAPEAATNTLAGPGMALLRTAAASAPADFHFISIGRGQGSEPTTSFLKGTNLYNAFMVRALELKGTVTFGAIFIMLGITERYLPPADQPGYPDRIRQIVADIRADLGEPNLPVLYCDYEMGATGTLAPTGSVGVVILPLTRMIPSLVPNLVLVPTDGLEMQDDHHFDFAGQKLWSERAIGLMKTKGWFPWGP